jgi:hypothetical protein
MFNSIKLLSFFVVFETFVLMPGFSFADNYYSYALIVGSNRAASGQSRLQYAHLDAARIKSTLVDVGHFKRKNVEILLDPDKADLETALDNYQKIFERHAQRDEKTRFIFYYSGHAHLSGLILGPDEFDTRQLRKRLLFLPATVKLVLLDACQTGEFSSVKGVAAANGFSSNMMDDLNVQGMAVIASSTASELSQESSKLKGSYFSHHFAVGLRGAADSDKDGVVTLQEVYRYAYNMTLSSTAASMGGRQHATLEIKLKGKGGMPLSWPGKNRTRLELPKDLEGNILLTLLKTNAVVADIRKVKGRSFTVSINSGKYSAFVKLQGSRALLCNIEVRQNSLTVFDTSDCKELALEADTIKGGGPAYKVKKTRVTPRNEWVFIEFQGGCFNSGSSGYTSRLKDFGYTDLQDYYGFAGVINLLFTPLPYFSIGAVIANMDSRSGDNNLTGVDQTVSWSSFRAGGFLRGNLPLGRRLFVPYVQMGAGGAKAVLTLEYTNESGTGTVVSSYKGGYFSIGGGLNVNPLRWFGLTVCQVEYISAPLLEMEGIINEKHNNGGVAITTGLRFGY